MVKWDTITHDFPGSSIDGTFWPGSYGTAITVASNRAAWPSGANYSGRATQGYDLIGSALLIQYQPVATGGYSGSHLKADASNVDIAEFTWSSSSGPMKWWKVPSTGPAGRPSRTSAKRSVTGRCAASCGARSSGT